MQIRPSALDATVTVIEVESGDEGPVVDMLETRGHGYAILGVEPTTTGTPCPLPDGVHGERHKLAPVEALEVVENDLPRGQIQSHLEGTR